MRFARLIDLAAFVAACAIAGVVPACTPTPEPFDPGSPSPPRRTDGADEPTTTTTTTAGSSDDEDEPLNEGAESTDGASSDGADADTDVDTGTGTDERGRIACPGKRESEPNDAKGQASPLGKVTCGTLGHGDVDVFVLDKAKDEVHSFIFESAEPARLEVYTKSGKKIARETNTVIKGRFRSDENRVFFEVSRPSSGGQAYRITLLR